jgi:hypothetical protein
MNAELVFILSYRIQCPQRVNENEIILNSFLLTTQVEG